MSELFAPSLRQAVILMWCKQRYSCRFRKKMVKRCAWGLCNSDTRYPERLAGGVKFIPFPKPTTNLEKCLRWIKACGRPHEQLNVKKVEKNYQVYVCTKHFVDGAPSERYPDPLPPSLQPSMCDSAKACKKQVLQKSATEPPRKKQRKLLAENGRLEEESEEMVPATVAADGNVPQQPQQAAGPSVQCTAGLILWSFPTLWIPSNSVQTLNTAGNELVRNDGALTGRCPPFWLKSGSVKREGAGGSETSAAMATCRQQQKAAGLDEQTQVSGEERNRCRDSQMPGYPLLSGQADGARMESRDPAQIPEVKIEIDVAEEMPEAWLQEEHAKASEDHHVSRNMPDVWMEKIDAQAGHSSNSVVNVGQDQTDPHKTSVNVGQDQTVPHETGVKVAQDQTDPHTIDVKVGQNQTGPHTTDVEVGQDQTDPHNTGVIEEHDETDPAHTISVKVEQDETDPFSYGVKVGQYQTDPHNIGVKVEQDDTDPHNIGDTVEQDETAPHTINVKVEQDETDPHNIGVTLEQDETAPQTISVRVEQDETAPQTISVRVEQDETYPHIIDVKVEQDETDPHNTGVKVEEGTDLQGCSPTDLACRRRRARGYCVNVIDKGAKRNPWPHGPARTCLKVEPGLKYSCENLDSEMFIKAEVLSPVCSAPSDFKHGPVEESDTSLTNMKCVKSEPMEENPASQQNPVLHYLLSLRG